VTGSVDRAARRRETDAYRRLRDVGLGHLTQTLRVLTLQALTDRRDDEHPRGWVAAPRKWLAERTGLTVRTITRHIQGLIEAGELVEWTPPKPRTARPREYLVGHLAHVRSIRRAEKREYLQKREPLPSKGQQVTLWGTSTTPNNPLNTLPPDPPETVESSETVTQQGPAGDIDDSALLRDGVDNSKRERPDPVPSDPVPESILRSWSDAIAYVSASTFQSQKANHRAMTVGLGRCLDRVANEQGTEEAGAVFGRAVTRSLDGESFLTALRDELKTVLDLDGFHGEQEFADTCADRTIPMTVPRLDDWLSVAIHHTRKETGA
jgi:hypothetical protein